MVQVNSQERRRGGLDTTSPSLLPEVSAVTAPHPWGGEALGRKGERPGVTCQGDGKARKADAAGLGHTQTHRKIHTDTQLTDRHTGKHV